MAGYPVTPASQLSGNSCKPARTAGVGFLGGPPRDGIRRTLSNVYALEHWLSGFLKLKAICYVHLMYAVIEMDGFTRA